MFKPQDSTPLNKIESPFLNQKGLSLYIKRDDLIHPSISGNKWRKLKYNLIDAGQKGFDHILTFGGAYSNHIAATAAACNEFGFRSTGIIRGDELNEQSNATLIQAAKNGMKLHFISREQYKRKEDEDFMASLIEQFSDFYLVPEGGSNAMAVKGCTEIVDEIEIEFDHIITAVGTGGTLSGLVCGLRKRQRAMGISVLKGADYLNEEVDRLINLCLNEHLKNWELNHDHHLGGYAKSNNELINFINEFKHQHGIQLDPIYTGKMMMALFDLIEKDYFETGDTIIALHTGGLQGIEGFNQRMGNVIVS